MSGLARQLSYEGSGTGSSRTRAHGCALKKALGRRSIGQQYLETDPYTPQCEIRIRIVMAKRKHSIWYSFVTRRFLVSIIFDLYDALG